MSEKRSFTDRLSRRQSRLNFHERERWDLTWKGLSYKVPVKADVKSKNPLKKSPKQWKEVLNNVSGKVMHGEAIAILGPSGAGKSTLLNVLAGRLSTGVPTGTIKINGRRRDSSWKRIAAYVEQSDVMYKALTVKETITFAAMLKLPSTMSKEAKQHRVESTLLMLGLGHVADTRIGDNENRGISGGEKKRVSIAIELVTDPGFIFLDEPTSGLDAFTAQTVADKITRLADFEQRTVLLTIHQPRLKILQSFTKIILITKGKIIFFGTVDEALDHFKNHGFECPSLENPADFFLDLITIDRRSEELEQESTARVDKLIGFWDEESRIRQAEADEISDSSSDANHSVIESKDIFQSNIWYETMLILQRYFRIQFRDYQTLVGQLGTDFASIQSRIGLLFFIPINQTFVIIVPLIDSFTRDRDIIMRERYSSTYRIFSAYFAKFISLLPVQFILTTLFCFMIYYITGLRTDGFQYFLVFYGFNLLLALCAITLGLLIAASVPSTAVGQIVGPLIVVVFLIFGGTLANSNQITWILRWIQYISPIFYCYSALIQNELSGQQFGQVSGDEYLDLYTANTVSPTWCMGAMLILAGAFFVGGFFAIRITTRPKTILI